MIASAIHGMNTIKGHLRTCVSDFYLRETKFFKLFELEGGKKAMAVLQKRV
jgi:hypothetical protein